MNTVEKHETDETCNVCGKQNVVNEYGRKSCDAAFCEASKHSTDIHWNSTEEEIMAWQDEQLDTLTIDGTETSALIKTDNVDDYCLNQVQEMVNHEAFQNDIRIMPDAHGGAGAVIGFTMPLGERIVPNTVGVDIGCGMTAFNLGSGYEIDERVENHPREMDERIRDTIPLGFDTFADIPYSPDYHMHDDFPWDECVTKARRFNTELAKTDLDIPQVDDMYGPDYFDALCERIGYDPMRAINSLGTLGGGNHFIEVSKSEKTGDYWVVVHSGSRGIGNAIAQWWQERAHENCDDRAEAVRDGLADVPEWAYKFDLDEVDDGELLQWVQGGMGEDFKDTDEIRARLDGEDIGELVSTMQDIARTVQEGGDGHDLDYLDGSNRAGYLKDMIFAQTYAIESRHHMCRAVQSALGATITDTIDSIHNYIDFNDLTIRKGATRVHEGERGVVPFNMRDGAVIVEGRGNDDWNRSAPHGAGRRGSRTWAYDEFSVAEYQKEMQGVFSTSVNESTLDEAPMAYKDTDDILGRIHPTAEVVDTLTPKINVKAE